MSRAAEAKRHSSRPRHVENAGESDFLHPRPARYFAALDGVENMPFNTAWLA